VKTGEMNKGSLVDEVSRRTDLAPSAVARVVDEVLRVVRERVIRGERVVLSGFGTFERVRRNPRTGRNPHTREAVRIPARNQPSFRAGAGFRESVAAKRRTVAKKPVRRARRS
jgi:DNA-binding protein HU-beta